MTQAESISSIKLVALSCLFVLQDFRGKLEAYDKSLDRGKTRGLARDLIRKVRWELTMKTEVQNLRAYLLAHTSSLNIRLLIEELYVKLSSLLAAPFDHRVAKRL